MAAPTKREDSEAERRQREAEDQMRRRQAFRVKLPKPAARIIREDRDSH